MCHPTGQQTQAFQLLDLLHLRIELVAIFLGLLLLRDVTEHPLPGDGSVDASDRGIDDVVPAVVFRALHLPAYGLALLRPIIRAPGTRLVEIVQHLVAGLAGGIATRARNQLGVHELDLAVGRADVDQPIEPFHNRAVARFAVPQGVLGLLARADVARGGQHDGAPVNRFGAQGHLDPKRGTVVEVPAQPLEGRGTLADSAANLIDGQRGLIGSHAGSRAARIPGQQVCAGGAIQARRALVGVENLAGAGVVHRDGVAHGVKQRLVIALGTNPTSTQPGTDDQEERKDHVLLQIHAANPAGVEQGVVDKCHRREAHQSEKRPGTAPFPASQEPPTTQSTEPYGHQVGRVGWIGDRRDLAGERGKLFPPRGLVMDQPGDLRVKDSVMRKKVGSAENEKGSG